MPKQELISAARMPNAWARGAETYLKRKVYAVEADSVLQLSRLYALAYADLRNEALASAERMGVRVMGTETASTQWRAMFEQYAAQRLQALTSAVMGVAGNAALTAARGAYYGRLWVLDGMTHEQTPINKPPFRADMLQEQDANDAMLESLLGRQWRAQYSTEMDGLLVDLRRSIGTGMQQGEGIPTIMSRVAGTMGVSTDRRRGAVGSAERMGYRANFNRVQALTRTMVNKVSNDGSIAAYRANADIIIGYEWLAALDERTCPQCQALNGKFYPRDSDYRPPAHPNCILPGNEVVIPGKLIAATQSFYDGRAIEITLSSGRRLTITPNHPIATPQGWIKAKLLKCGDDILSTGNGERIAAGINPNNDHTPTRIEEVFRAFKESGGVSTGAMEASSVDFHGDARYFNGNVNIVYADGALLRDRVTTHAQPIREDRFSGHDSDLALLAGDSGLLQFSDAPHPALSGDVSTCDHCGSLFVGATLPSLAHAFTTSTDNNSVRLEMGLEGSSGDTALLADFLERNAAFVELDQIVNIRDFQFCGHVYDLQVDPHELYITNGIITHNCRCTIIPTLNEVQMATPRELPPELFPQWAEGFGMNREIADFINMPTINAPIPRVVPKLTEIRTVDGVFKPPIGSPGASLDTLNEYIAANSEGAVSYAMADPFTGMLKVDYSRADDYFLIDRAVVKQEAAAFVQESLDIRYSKDYLLQLAAERAADNGVTLAASELEAAFNATYAARAEAIETLARIDNIRLTEAQLRRLAQAREGGYLDMVYSREGSSTGSLQNAVTRATSSQRKPGGSQNYAPGALEEARANFREWVQGIE